MISRLRKQERQCFDHIKQRGGLKRIFLNISFIYPTRFSYKLRCAIGFIFLIANASWRVGNGLSKYNFSCHGSMLWPVQLKFLALLLEYSRDCRLRGYVLWCISRYGHWCLCSNQSSYPPSPLVHVLPYCCFSRTASSSQSRKLLYKPFYHESVL